MADTTARALRELLKLEAIHIVPELYDCAGARAAQINGFQIIMLSSSALACGLTGIPDLQLLSVDEFVWVTERITNMCALPLLIDADDGFGRPLAAYQGCKRLVKAGAAGVLITDSAELGKNGVAPMEDAVLRFRAARDGLGPDGYLIARVDTNPETEYEQTIERCLAYREAGADMICVLWMHKVSGDKLALCKKLNARDPGPKWYPDLSSSHGVSELNIDDLVPFGYRMVGVHYHAHAAMLAMLDTGRHVFESRTNCYVEEHYRDTGYNFFTAMVLYGLADNTWPSIEQKYVKNPADAISVRSRAYFVREDDKY
jgi:methylisocitrate lyase